MHNNDTPFVFISGIYLIVLYVVSLIRSPRFMQVSAQKAYYDKRGYPNYLKFLAVVLVAVVAPGLPTW